MGDPHQSFFEEKVTPVKGFGIVVAGDRNEFTSRRHELVLQGEPSLGAAFLECGVVGFVHITIQHHSVERCTQRRDGFQVIPPLWSFVPGGDRTR